MVRSCTIGRGPLGPPRAFVHLHLQDARRQPRPDGIGHVALNDSEVFNAAVQTARDLATGVEELIPDKLIPVAIEIRDADGWLVVTVPVVRS